MKEKWALSTIRCIISISINTHICKSLLSSRNCPYAFTLPAAAAGLSATFPLLLNIPIDVKPFRSSKAFTEPSAGAAGAGAAATGGAGIASGGGVDAGGCESRSVWLTAGITGMGEDTGRIGGVAVGTFGDVRFAVVDPTLVEDALPNICVRCCWIDDACAAGNAGSMACICWSNITLISATRLIRKITRIFTCDRICETGSPVPAPGAGGGTAAPPANGWPAWGGRRDFSEESVSCCWTGDGPGGWDGPGDYTIES